MALRQRPEFGLIELRHLIDRTMQRIAITGSSGYYGRKLVEHIRRESPETLLLGIDVIPPRDVAPHEFFQADVRRPDVRAALTLFSQTRSYIWR